ncbi:MAG: type II toxin-antitoxin system VapC family toxin [Saprospiraceae bacterium]|nr:type II toxin-antitoxin system VapC family toxin [Saprospiraceae bacterium]
MSLYYFDTSALSKRYVQEIGSQWVRTLILSPDEHTILSSELTMVELYSALARRKRDGSVPAQDCDIAVQAFTEHCVTRFEIVDLNPVIIEKTRVLLDKYP